MSNVDTIQLTTAVSAGQQRSPLPEALHPKAAAQAAANAARAAAAFQQQRPIGKLTEPCLKNGLSSTCDSVTVFSKPHVHYLSLMHVAFRIYRFITWLFYWIALFIYA